MKTNKTLNRTRLVALVALVVISLFSMACMLSPKSMEESLIPDAASQFYDNQGKVIYTTASKEKRLPVSFDKIPKHLQQAFISIEDNRFYEHGGIDYRGTMRALWSNIRGQEVQGGSTITQQLAKNAFLSQERTLTRKIKEAFLAKQLESNYTKDEILDMYLNRIYFGQGAYGVESASLFYFNKHVQDLDIAEAAVLAAIPKSPNYFNPFENPKDSKQRQELVIDQMVKYGYISAEDGAKAKAEKLKLNKSNNNKVDLRTYFFDYVTQRVIEEFGADALYKGGLKIYTTLDSPMQAHAEQALEYLPDLYNDDYKLTQPQVGLVAVDPTTGYIKAMVGGRGQDKFNRAALAVRQPGSSFKPFVYLTAMDNGMTAATIVEDKPFKQGDWAPENYSHTWHGKVSLRTALKKSYNIPAILVAQKVGTTKVVQMAKALGITTLVEDGQYTDDNPAMALGGLSKGVTPLEMAAAYGTIGNNGNYNTPVAITKIVNREGKVIFEHKVAPKQVVSAKAAYQTTDMLQDVLISGTGAGAGIGRPAAGKTGTTDTYKDAWFVGYTPNLSCAVWVGDDNGKSMGLMTGSMAPLSIWQSFMLGAVQTLPYAEFDRPEGAVTPGEPAGQGGYSGSGAAAGGAAGGNAGGNTGGGYNGGGYSGGGYSGGSTGGGRSSGGSSRPAPKQNVTPKAPANEGSGADLADAPKVKRPPKAPAAPAAPAPTPVPTPKAPPKPPVVSNQPTKN